MSQKDAFYVGAAIYLNLDSIEVDAALAEQGLVLTEDTIAECRDAIRDAYPERYEAGRQAAPGPRETWTLPRG
jgi:hypothetical protein